jgi:uncharacterized Fe-S cluster-containing radical SAM superfamily protein
MLKKIWRSLLDVAVPCAGGEEVKIDGFKLLNNRDVTHNIFDGAHRDGGRRAADCRKGAMPCREGPSSFQNIHSAALYEPRIHLIGLLLESLLNLIDLESDGSVVGIDGFRLKDPGQWTVPSACDPAEIFEYAGTRCNCDCVFCYLKGKPPLPALDFPRRTAAEELEEIRTRLKYFSPRKKKSLFPGPGSTCEVLAHPHILEILAELRLKTEKPFRLITNGAALMPETIGALSDLAPVYLDVSLNSASLSRRRRLMRDVKPEVAINALPLLKSARIPYSVVIVPWPLESVEEMLADLDSTTAYAVEHDACLVQVSLPGYSGYFSPEEVFDRDFLWRLVVSRVQNLRKKYDYPVVIMPGMFEEYVSRPVKNVPEVIGVVRNSPAYHTGVRRGDVILGLGGFAVCNRPQAREILSMFRQGDVKSFNVTVSREDRELTLEVEPEKWGYPYSRAMDTHLGMVFMGTGLRAGYLERLREIVLARRAREVLFLSSTLVRPVFEQLLNESFLFAGGRVNIHIAVPENRFFGGNIFMGDLLVVEDFIDCINDFVWKEGEKPDLVVIPSSPFSLSGWGRDLSGRCHLDIERAVNIPVEILPCRIIYD